MDFSAQIGAFPELAEWDAAVLGTGQGCIYQTTDWSRYLETRHRTTFFFRVQEGPRTIARLLAWKSGEGESYFDGRFGFVKPLLERFLPVLTWIEGPLVHDPERWPEILEFLLANLVEYATVNKFYLIKNVTLPLAWYPERRARAAEIFHLHGFSSSPWATYLVDLGQPEEKLWENLFRKHRTLIRKAVASGLSVERISGPEQLPQYLDLLARFRDSAGLPMPPNYPDQAMWKIFREGSKSSLDMHLAYYAGKLVGAQPVIGSGERIFLLAPAQSKDPQLGKLNVNDLLTWRVIADNCGRHHWYDLAGADPGPRPGSAEAGIRHFKKKFATDYLEYDRYSLSLSGLKSIPVKLLKKFRN